MCNFGDLPLCEGTACGSMRVRAHVKKKAETTYHIGREQRNPSQYLHQFFPLYFIPYGAPQTLQIPNSMIAFSFAFSSSFASI